MSGLSPSPADNPSCAACCEAPNIQVGRAVWHLGSLRHAFSWWQERLNGFELTWRQAPQILVFRCTHFDAETRRCDSYDSRAGMCRNYPRAMLWQPKPELFEGCGYRAVALSASGLLQELVKRDLPAEQLEELKERLHLE